MAANQVTIKIPYSKIVTLSSGHTSNWRNGKKGFYISASSSTEPQTLMAESTCRIDLAGALPDTAVVNSFNFNIETEITAATGGTASVSYFILVDGTQYAIDGSSGIVAHINRFKSQNGKFPSIIVQIVTQYTQPTSGTLYAYSTMDYPVFVCTIEGSQELYRPIADVSVGHEIPSGFGGVYQLVNESVADDDATCIQSHGGYTEASSSGVATTEDKTSIVTIGAPSIKKSKLTQLRLLARLAMFETQMGAIEVVYMTIIANGVEYQFKQEYPAAMNIFPSEGDAWVKEAYYTFEGIVPWDSSLIDAINSYRKTSGNMPEIQISLNTYAKGYCNTTTGDNTGSKTTTGECDTKLSQVYLEAVYEDDKGINVYRNEGGTWKQAQVAYEKRNGVWVEITEEECKSILQSAPLCTKS